MLITEFTMKVENIFFIFFISFERFRLTMKPRNGQTKDVVEERVTLYDCEIHMTGTSVVPLSWDWPAPRRMEISLMWEP